MPEPPCALAVRPTLFLPSQLPVFQSSARIRCGADLDLGAASLVASASAAAPSVAPAASAATSADGPPALPAAGGRARDGGADSRKRALGAYDAGLRCFKAKEWGAAVRHFDLAISAAHPRLGSCHNLRGEARSQLGDLVGAFQDLDQAVALMPRAGEPGHTAPGNIATYINRATCYKKVGRYPAAMADLREALLLDPKHKQAAKSLAQLELAMLPDSAEGSSSAEGSGSSAEPPPLNHGNRHEVAYGVKCGYSNALADTADAVAFSSVSAEHKRSTPVVVAGGDSSPVRSTSADHDSEMDSGEAGGVEEARAHAAVLGGRTGSGKTEILHRLRDAGHAVLDLEALACHRGSAFGAIGQEPQPTNEQYENRCALAWWTQSARALHAKGTPSSIVPTSLHKGRVWMEHEGAHVGKCKVPLGLLALLNAAEGGFVVVEMPREMRVQRLVDDYCRADQQDALGACGGYATPLAAVVMGTAAVASLGTGPSGGTSRATGAVALSAAGALAVKSCVDCARSRVNSVDAELRACIENLRKRLGEADYAKAMGLLAEGDHPAVADLMLDYYDKLYDHHRESNTSRKRAVVCCSTVVRPARNSLSLLASGRCTDGFVRQDAGLNAMAVLQAADARSRLPDSDAEIDLTHAMKDNP